MSAQGKSFLKAETAGNPGADKDLWTKFRMGDSASFSIIISKYYDDVFTYGMRFTANREMVKDTIQDIFLVLWKNRQTLGPTSHVKFYLMKTLRRNLQQALKKNNRYLFSKAINFEQLTPADMGRQEQLIKDEQLAGYMQKIKKAMLELSPRQQEIIYLRFYAGADNSDIASVMNIRKQSVYNLLHDALKKLKKAACIPENAHFTALNLLF